MKKANLAYLAAALMSSIDCYGRPLNKVQKAEPPRLSKDEKQRLKDERQLHVFMINGVQIEARNKKDARKIYNRKK